MSDFPSRKTMSSDHPVVEVQRFRVAVVAGADAGAEVNSRDGRITVGTAEGVTLRLTDPTVSHFHAEFEAVPNGILARDLGSTNGTQLGRTHLRDALVREPTDHPRAVSREALPE